MAVILLVDDDSVDNFITQRIIGHDSRQHTVHVKLNGLDALKFLQELSDSGNALPDLIFLDLELPIIDGFQFLKAFRELTMPGKEKIRIVVLSLKQGADERARAMSLGAQSFLNKPLTPDGLRMLLETTLD